jgi:hypothetical protein
MTNKGAERVGVTPSLGLQQVKDWLRGHHPNTTVGYRKSALGCPLAQYLRNTTGVIYTVGDTYGPYEQPHDRVPAESLPEWALDFIEHVDMGNAHEPVSAAEALAVLEVIEA